MSKALKIGNIQIGGGHFALIAGPCTVESESQILEVARSVKQSGASLLRGGAFKGRTSPYDFQGLGEEGIKLLLKAKEATETAIENMELPVLKIFMEECIPAYYLTLDELG